MNSKQGFQSGDEQERPTPKFSLDQIVVMTSTKKAMPFRILEVIWDDGWFYRWDRKNCAAEHMIRPLTAEESGSDSLPLYLSENSERASDKPPAHWEENDGWKRHPQTAEEWNWHNDGSPDAGRRSELRLNFAGDRADPHAPDQMALILRIDLLRIMGRMQHAEAYKRFRLEREGSKPTTLEQERPALLALDLTAEDCRNAQQYASEDADSDVYMRFFQQKRELLSALSRIGELENEMKRELAASDDLVRFWMKRTTEAEAERDQLEARLDAMEVKL